MPRPAARRARRADDAQTERRISSRKKWAEALTCRAPRVLFGLRNRLHSLVIIFYRMKKPLSICFGCAKLENAKKVETADRRI
jgi:hypothetical protein